jgi:hypothetical protein
MMPGWVVHLPAITPSNMHRYKFSKIWKRVRNDVSVSGPIKSGAYGTGKRECIHLSLI